MKNTKFVWNKELETYFQHIANQITNATEHTRYNPHLEYSAENDASRAGLGAALEQLSATGCQTVAFTSEFFDAHGEKYNFNKLEILGVVCSF